jgi:hypothetical protein
MTTTTDQGAIDALVGFGVNELAAHADAIRALGKRAVQDIIEIGRRLIDAKQIAGHGGWLPWLEREFGWSDNTAERFVQVAKKVAKFPNLGDLDVPVSGLYLLASPSTPAEVIEAVAERSAAGERLSIADVKGEMALAKRVLNKVKETRDSPTNLELVNLKAGELDDLVAKYNEAEEKIVDQPYERFSPERVKALVLMAQIARDALSLIDRYREIFNERDG